MPASNKTWPLIRFDCGVVYVTYDATRVARCSAWSDLERRFRDTFTAPSLYPDGSKNYEDSNPWRRDHTYAGSEDWRGREIEPVWSWYCSEPEFCTRYTAAAERAQAATAPTTAQTLDKLPWSVRIWARIKSLLWGNW